MIKIDLITGYLGSGKTTFIKRYAAYLLRQGLKIAILENDLGAVNVDRMLLQELEGERCTIETVAGACDADCHKRRFKTKLIALGMSGYDRVLVEPSGVYDTDEFFDTLREEPLERWYEIGSVITMVDAGMNTGLSAAAEYYFALQLANAGTVVLTKTEAAAPAQLAETLAYIRTLSGGAADDRLLLRTPEEYTDDDFCRMMDSGFRKADFVKRIAAQNSFGALYYMNTGMTAEKLADIVRRLFADKACGQVMRVKGYVQQNGGWLECNADKNHFHTAPSAQGQDIVLVIGEGLQKTVIDAYFSDNTR